MTWMTLARIGIVTAFGALAVLAGVWLVESVFRLIDRPDSDASPRLMAASSQLRGGAWIGALERLATYAFLVAGFPAGLAMVIAMKGLARYPELKVSSAGPAERFIIGTFVSMLWAAAMSGLSAWTTGLLP